MQEKSAEQAAKERAVKERAAKELAAKRAKYPVFDGGVTDEVRQSWKQANGRVIAVDVFDDMAGEHHIAYFRRPTMDVMSAVSAVSKEDELKGADTMFKNCWLGGSPLVQNDAILKTSALGALGRMFAMCHTEIKNL